MRSVFYISSTPRAVVHRPAQGTQLTMQSLRPASDLRKQNCFLMRLLGTIKFKRHSCISIAERHDINTLKDGVGILISDSKDNNF